MTLLGKQRVLVIGGSGAMGTAIAARVVANGGESIIVGRDAARLTATAATIGPKIARSLATSQMQATQPDFSPCQAALTMSWWPCHPVGHVHLQFRLRTWPASKMLIRGSGRPTTLPILRPASWRRRGRWSLCLDQAGGALVRASVFGRRSTEVLKPWQERQRSSSGLGAQIGVDDEVGHQVRPRGLDQDVNLPGRAGAAFGIADDPAHGVPGGDGTSPHELLAGL